MHVLLPWHWAARPVSSSNPSPGTLYLVIGALSTIMWAAASACTILMLDKYKGYYDERQSEPSICRGGRVCYRLTDHAYIFKFSIVSAVFSFLSLQVHMTPSRKYHTLIPCRSCCVLQIVSISMVRASRFSEEQIREAYLLATNVPSERFWGWFKKAWREA